MVDHGAPINSTCPIVSMSTLTGRTSLCELFRRGLNDGLRSTSCKCLSGVVDRVGKRALILRLVTGRVTDDCLALGRTSRLISSRNFATVTPRGIVCDGSTSMCPRALQGVVATLFRTSRLSIRVGSLLGMVSLVSNINISVHLLRSMLTVRSGSSTGALVHSN